ncbi:hypothetical protein NQ318_013185 [Aromia moschata]|uniref:Transposase n=1 Tax=Aromia moschata TaxID=1265417 RepID=A0AAV8X3K9_9CUCU|nr:hypothetical protein NQ318_013185 [Aromia moschata]
MGNRVLNDVGFYKRILFSDESTFSTNGVVSSQHCREIGDVKDLPKSGLPKITQDKKFDIVLSMEEDYQSASTLVASENEVSQTTVLRILRKRKLLESDKSSLDHRSTYSTSAEIKCVGRNSRKQNNRAFLI